MPLFFFLPFSSLWSVGKFKTEFNVSNYLSVLANSRQGKLFASVEGQKLNVAEINLYTVYDCVLGDWGLGLSLEVDNNFISHSVCADKFELNYKK